MTCWTNGWHSSPAPMPGTINEPNMDPDLFRIETNHVTPARGSVLISEPFLRDPCFGRSVILLVEHNDEGTMGLVLNKPLPLHLNDIFEDLGAHGANIPIFRGGPLSMDTLFYLHTLAGIQGALPVKGDLYLNGDFAAVCRYISEGNQVQGKLRFFLGYAGWAQGQLHDEIEDDTWMVSNENLDCAMDDDVSGLWERELSKLGYKYRLWTHFPLIPSLN